MIVFVRTKNETETLAEKLRARGFSAQAINGDVYVTLLTKPEVKDVKNTKDPITDKPVADNEVVLIGNSLVHLASQESVEAIRKDPAAALAKAEKSAQPEKKG